MLNTFPKCNHSSSGEWTENYSSTFITFNKVFKRNICYDVIGGWLPEFVNKRKWLGAFLKKINYIFVETESMKEQLESQGYDNVEVIPNCKELDILDAKTIKYT